MNIEKMISKIKPFYYSADNIVLKIRCGRSLIVNVHNIKIYYLYLTEMNYDGLFNHQNFCTG